MTKGLEALESINGNCDLFDKGYQWDQEFSKQFNEYLDIIEKELKEKEKQDDYIKSLEDRIDNLETSYLRDKKALEIIKEHTLYCENVDYFVFVNITKEVNDLLKEVLLCH